MSTSVASGSQRSYAEAIQCLNSLQSNAATLEATKASGGIYNDRIMPESLDYLKRIGYTADDLNKLNVIHITGTKGKGSTSAFCSSILTTLAPSAKVGLYTSPHMVAVRERIRINGKPLSEDKFAKYFFDVWDRFEENRQTFYPGSANKPAYFRYVTTMAFHVFLQEQVDATVLEVGIGGTYDSTNIVPKPLATGVTALGLDHVPLLGRTLEEIAHQKAGIFKDGCPALSVEQPEGALAVLKRRSEELKASHFAVVKQHAQIPDIKLGLAGVHQRSNASLAVALVQDFLESRSLPAAFSAHSSMLNSTQTGMLPEQVVEGLQNARWPGRCQVVEDRQPERQGVTWYLDGAHTVESLVCCAEWFVEAAFRQERPRKRVLVFNCTSGRSAEALLRSLTDTMSQQNKKMRLQPEQDPLFDHVIFCTNATYAEGSSKADLTSHMIDPNDVKALTVQYELAAAWQTLSRAPNSPISPQTEVQVMPSIQHAVRFVQGQNESTSPGDSASAGVDVLVSGSLHLIGGVFEVAQLEFAL